MVARRTPVGHPRLRLRADAVCNVNEDIVRQTVHLRGGERKLCQLNPYESRSTHMTIGIWLQHWSGENSGISKKWPMTTSHPQNICRRPNTRENKRDVKSHKRQQIMIKVHKRCTLNTIWSWSLGTHESLECAMDMAISLIARLGPCRQSARWNLLTHLPTMGVAPRWELAITRSCHH